ncbi:MAG TPA: hypothetical protein VM120_23960 [Bryobacteraceae bacterium]|nr:hypothetical protein [Bryobacteraceae bacterium]
MKIIECKLPEQIFFGHLTCVDHGSGLDDRIGRQRVAPIVLKTLSAPVVMIPPDWKTFIRDAVFSMGYRQPVVTKKCHAKLPDKFEHSLTRLLMQAPKLFQHSGPRTLKDTPRPAPVKFFFFNIYV